MFKRLAPLLICLLAATAAHAQIGGGGHGHGARRGGKSSGSNPAPAAAAAAAKPPTPVNQLQIIGVIKAIDRTTGRVTIAYDPVPALSWPAGAQPFPVAKSALLDGATVGEKVRFSLDSWQISALSRF